MPQALVQRVLAVTAAQAIHSLPGDKAMVQCRWDSDVGRWSLELNDAVVVM